MQRQLTEIVKHGAAAGQISQPERPDWTIDQGWENYSAEEHATWKTLFERQTKLLPGRACDEFMQGMRDLPIGAEQIPGFRRLSDVLMRRTGWQVVAVPGLVPDEVFFEHLANRRFPSGHFIRKTHELDYLEEPDVFHDVFGHVPMLMNPAIADYIQAYGEGGLRAQRLGKLANLPVSIGTRSNSVCCSSRAGCESTARVSPRPIRKAPSLSMILRRTESDSTWSV